MDLEKKLSIERDFLVSCPNIAELLPETDLTKIGHRVVQDFDADLLSRQEWERRNDDAMRLALQTVEPKSFPWVGASNVKFPLLTIAALQYHARAYPNLINGETIVKYKVYGSDPVGERAIRGERIETHMTYQLLEEDAGWEGEMDKVLITQPIVGCAFKKTYWNPITNSAVSDNIFAKELVVNYWTKSLSTAPRITHVLFFQKNDIYERVVRGLWLDCPESRPSTSLDRPITLSPGTPPETTDSSSPFEFLEQHCFLDLDQDGYAEPYIVTVQRDSKKVRRIVARFTSEGIKRDKEKTILSIAAEQFFTKYPFIPSPDGGFYDLGFGALLGPLNASIDTAINQMIDAGTMATTAGGFLSKGVRIRGGNFSFSPLEWKHVESTGDDLRKGIFPLPIREPSPVLFQLLGLLINYGERIGMSVDIMVGENPGQNTPAETSRTMVEQGTKIFNGIFKRTYRSFKEELRKLYRLNQLNLADETEIAPGQLALWDDYAKSDVRAIYPAADPNIVSDQQRLMQAETVRAAALSSFGFDLYQVNRNYLKALKVQNVEVLLPDPAGPNAPQPTKDIKLQLEEMRQAGDQRSEVHDMKLAMLTLMNEASLHDAKIINLEAQAEYFKAQAATAATGQQLAAIQTQIGLERDHKNTILKAFETMSKVKQLQEKLRAADNSGNV